jgi:hypothetical protein
METNDFTENMKLVNSRGRVLLEVTAAHATGIDERGFIGVTYSYDGDGRGGNVTLVQLGRTIEAIIADNPSAKLVGYLPKPRIIVPIKNELDRKGGAR